ncbi:MAG: alpha-amylase family glycosyl hydrolase [Faecalibacillus sp.]
MWFNESVFYQIYTLNFCGAPRDNDGIVEHRILRLNDFMDYFEDLGINAIYFNPVFSSDHHGYDTRDYCKIDERLGTNEDFIEICKNLHDRGMRVVLDGVFNHVGRGFFAFQDVLNNRENSQYKNWFRIDFNGNSPYNDGFYYEGWEGHYELVKLNLDYPDVQNYLLSAVDYWIDAFDIDGIRLDVAYSLPRWFMAMLKDHCRQKKADFFLLGEVLGDNAGYMFSEAHLDSITDYPGFKGLWSSFNSLNMFEMAHTIKRNYGEMYRGQTLFSFVDNHDVERIASKLTDLEKLPLIYGMLFSLPGIPCIYYGSEWGQTGKKEQESDDSLRPEFTKPMPNDLTKYIKKLISIRNQSSALQKGEFKELVLTNKQFVFERNDQQEKLL